MSAWGGGPENSLVVLTNIMNRIVFPPFWRSIESLVVLSQRPVKVCFHYYDE